MTQAGPLTINPMASPAPQLVGRSGDLYRQRDRWVECPVPVGLRRRHAGRPRLSARADHHAQLHAARHLLRDRHRDRRQRRCRRRRPWCRRCTCRSRRIVPRVRPTSRSRTAPRPATACGWSTRTTTRSASSTPSPTRSSREITVGTAPRTLAIAPEWRGLGDQQAERHASASSTRRRSPSARTISLPFASQPFGIAMAPDRRVCLRRARGRRQAAEARRRRLHGGGQRRRRREPAARVGQRRRQPASTSRASSRHSSRARARPSCRRPAAARRPAARSSSSTRPP